MNRFFLTILSVAIAVSCTRNVNQAPDVSQVNNMVVISSPYVKDTVHFIALSDTHLYIYDQRNEPYDEYSRRMSLAYNDMTDFRDGSVTTPMESLKKTVALAKQMNVDAIFHLGDLVSFPSELGVEFASNVLGSCGIPYHYISGNHDWCYENLSDDPVSQRQEWREKRLTGLYQGNNPSMYAVTVNGVKFLMMDDTIGKLMPEQIEFMRKEISEDTPCIAMMHIPPMKASRHNIKGVMPYYLENSDEISALFRDGQENHHFLGVFAGHTHEKTLDVIDGLAQIVVPYNASGNYLEVYVIPAE